MQLSFSGPVLFGDEIAEGKLVKVCLDRKNLLLTRTKSKVVRAISNICTHKGVALDNGVFDGECIACPYHGRKFNLLGKSIGHRSPDLDAFAFSELDNIVWAGQVPILPTPFGRRVTGRESIACEYNDLVENTQDIMHLDVVHEKSMRSNPGARLLTDCVQSGNSTTCKVNLPKKNPIKKLVASQGATMVLTKFPFGSIIDVLGTNGLKARIELYVSKRNSSKSDLLWRVSRNFLTSPGIGALVDRIIRKESIATIQEDRSVLESIE